MFDMNVKPILVLQTYTYWLCIVVLWNSKRSMNLLRAI